MEDLLRRLKDVSKKVPIDYDEQYQKAVNIFRNCPIIDSNGILSRLNPMPKNIPWQKLIGFDPYSVLRFLPGRFQVCALFDGFSFITHDRSSLLTFLVPTYTA